MRSDQRKKLLITLFLSVASAIIIARLISSDSSQYVITSYPGLSSFELSEVKEYILSTSKSLMFQLLIVFASAFTFFPLPIQFTLIFYRVFAFCASISHTAVSIHSSAIPFAVYLVQTLIIVFACFVSTDYSSVDNKSKITSLPALACSFLTIGGASIIIGITPWIVNGLIH